MTPDEKKEWQARYRQSVRERNAIGKARQKELRKVQCKQGHPVTPETSTTDKAGNLVCRVCANANRRKTYKLQYSAAPCQKF